ncbi:uncharacterized protein LTR77_005721 [Saxophila tyrrhenica]|uniref:Clr5 domain-containing protein n=1 Tax=Saxophila tyrrhenica TaxID=1690608 RepID=A0AAV9PA42_9PEZI|nr:hypothetical protein LTR77_005721 [Saxophila tyrrhenica]
MPRVKIPLEPYRDQITSWRHEGFTRKEILEKLKNEENFSISMGLLCRHLLDWKVRVTCPRYVGDDELALQNRIVHYWQHNFADKGIAAELKKDGFEISVLTVGRRRREMGLLKRRERIGGKKHPPKAEMTGSSAADVDDEARPTASGDDEEAIVYDYD